MIGRWYSLDYGAVIEGVLEGERIYVTSPPEFIKKWPHVSVWYFKPAPETWVPHMLTPDEIMAIYKAECASNVQ